MPGRGRDLLVPAWAKDDRNGSRSSRKASRFGSAMKNGNNRIAQPPKGSLPPPIRPPPGMPPPIPGLGFPPLNSTRTLPRSDWKQYTRQSKTYYYNESTKQVFLIYYNFYFY